MTYDQWLTLLDRLPGVITAAGAITAAVLGLMNRGKLRAIHVDFNSRNDALLAANSRADLAEGKAQGGMDAAAIKVMIDEAIIRAAAIPAAVIVTDKAEHVAAALAARAVDVAAALKEGNHP